MCPGLVLCAYIVSAYRVGYVYIGYMPRLRNYHVINAVQKTLVKPRALFRLRFLERCLCDNSKANVCNILAEAVANAELH